MDRKELSNNPLNPLLALAEMVKSELWTALPGIIVSVNLEARTAVVQPAIKARVTPTKPPEDPEFDPWVQLPELLDCPIIFPQGGNYVISLPVAAGDEVLIIIASRCIDGWWSLGGVQEQLDIRMHDLSDGFVLPGVTSKAVGALAAISGADLEEPGGAPPLSGDALELRSKDGLTSVKLSAESVSVTHPVLITLAAPLILANGTPIP